jgi:2-keto-4-pentenoate hydratase/2-oxohepta-3-ene-1,7-dioic acid hydratase in catechol pathway
VIIGRAGRAIAREQAMEHVAGYSIFNDASVRDWQRHSSQFTPGKNFPATGGFGPTLVTPDEIDDLAALRVQTRLNGETMQDQALADLIFDVPALIAYLSAFTPLAPGDVIVSGTPGGVGDSRTPPVYLQPGDVVEVSIGTIGTLTNPVIAGSLRRAPAGLIALVCREQIHEISCRFAIRLVLEGHVEVGRLPEHVQQGP